MIAPVQHTLPFDTLVLVDSFQWRDCPMGEAVRTAGYCETGCACWRADVAVAALVGARVPPDVTQAGVAALREQCR